MRLRRFFLPFLGLFVALSIVAGYYGLQAHRYYERYEQNGKVLLYEFDPVVGYRLKPQVRLLTGTNPRFGIFTDERGARVGVDPISAHPEIFTAGCSFTFGQLVNYEQSFAGLLGKDYRGGVYNLGISGFSTVSALRHTQKYLDLHPKVVVYGLIDDHFHRNVIPCTSFWRSKNCRASVYLEPGTQGYREVPPSAEAQDVEEFALPHAFGWRDVLWAVRRDWNAATGRDGNGINQSVQQRLPSNAYVEAMRFAMGEWVRLARENSFELVVLYIPHPENPQALAPERRAVFAEFERDPRVHFVDATASFRRYLSAHRGESLCGSPTDCHPGPAAHALLAEELRPVLKKILR